MKPQISFGVIDVSKFEECVPNRSQGNLVLVKIFNRRKLDPYFTGPLKIIKKELNTIIVCDPISGGVAEINIHLKNVILYFSEI